MNTINAVGYLAGALTASPLIKRFGLAPSVLCGTWPVWRRWRSAR